MQSNQFLSVKVLIPLAFVHLSLLGYNFRFVQYIVQLKKCYLPHFLPLDCLCDKKIVLCVSDDGSGFSSTILNRGASPFLRDDNSEHGQNLGMGLYICRLLCEKHGGALTLENHHNGAKVTATFYF